MSTVRMFVNGQAMRGGSLHAALSGAEFLGPAETAPRYRFLSFGRFPGPAAGGPSGGAAIAGELYAVDYATLRERLLPGEPPELEFSVIELADGSGSCRWSSAGGRVRRHRHHRARQLGRRARGWSRCDARRPGRPRRHGRHRHVVRRGGRHGRRRPRHRAARTGRAAGGRRGRRHGAAGDAGRRRPALPRGVPLGRVRHPRQLRSAAWPRWRAAPRRSSTSPSPARRGAGHALDAKLAMAKARAATTPSTAASTRLGRTSRTWSRRYVEAGVRTVKLFTTYRGLPMVEIDTIEQVMRALNDVRRPDLRPLPRPTSSSRPPRPRRPRPAHPAAGHGRTRPEAAEARAVQEVLGAAERTGAPVYFVHQTIPAAVDEVIAARQRGVRAFSESCPHYLTLDDSCYAGEHPERFVCCPPLRGRAAVEALGTGWSAARRHDRQRPLLLRHRAEGPASTRRPGDAQRAAGRRDPAPVVQDAFVRPAGSPGSASSR